jgi:uncharacterized protein
MTTLNQLIGIGLRSPHYREIINNKPSIGWFEVHSENFFAQGGNSINFLKEIAEHYPISLHGVGLSLGSFNGVNINHLKKIKKLIDLIKPKFVSEHLSWGEVNGVYLPDLLPIPYNQESLDIFSKNIITTQDILETQILIENPSSYIEYEISNISEADFLVEICKNTNCKILLDINNIYVSAHNHQWNIEQYIKKIPQNFIKEIHLAGHSSKAINNEIILIDTHDQMICHDVWDIYQKIINIFGNIPTLIEWDNNIPSLEILINEAKKASSYLAKNKKCNNIHV